MTVRRIGQPVKVTLVCPVEPSAVRFCVAGLVRGQPRTPRVYVLGTDAEVTTTGTCTYRLTITIPAEAVPDRNWTIAAIGVGGEEDGDAEPKAVTFRVERSAFA